MEGEAGEAADTKLEANSPPMAGHRRGVSVEVCQMMIQRSLQIPKVRFLMESLEKSGRGIRGNFIKAVNCNQRIAGGYTRGRGITVCSNRMMIQDEVNQVVIHELIHAYDDCKARNLDWRNCAHHACSEIRAGHLSGDCHFIRELLRGCMTKIRGHGQDCVKRRVMKSLAANPYCSGKAVWDTCYNDTRPFDRTL